MQHAHSFASFRSHRREWDRFGIGVRHPVIVTGRAHALRRTDDGQLHAVPHPEVAPLSKRLSRLARDLEKLSESKRGNQYIKRASRPLICAVAALAAKQARQDRLDARGHAQTMPSAASSREVRS